MATNYTPETAFEITALPYIRKQTDISLAPDDAVNIPPDAIGNHAWNSVWYKFTPSVGQEFIFVTIQSNEDGSLPNVYIPLCTVWVGDPGSLSIYTIVQPGDDSVFSSQLSGGYYFRLPLTAGTEYYFQIIQDNTYHASAGASLDFIALLPVLATARIGSVVITDDDLGFPASILDPVTFNFVQYRREYPACEFAAVLPTGQSCLSENETNKTLAFLDGQLNLINTVTITESIGQIMTDRDAHFYVYATASDPVAKMYKYTAAGVQVYSKTLPSDFQLGFAEGAIALDGSMFYMAKIGSSGGARTTVYRYNLDTDTQPANLTVAPGAGNFIPSGDGFVTADGYLVFWKQSSTDDARLYKYDTTTGDTVLTLVPSKITYGNHFCYVDDTKLLVWGYDDSISINNPAFFEYISLIDGASLQVSPPIPVTSGSTINRTAGNPNAISNSCPLFVLTEALGVESSQRSGLYLLAVNKKNDGYYQSFNPVDSIVLPIRDPFAITGMVGDE